MNIEPPPVARPAAEPTFEWAFLMDVPNPVGDDFSLWACSLCGAIVPNTHEWIHLRLHRSDIPEWLANRVDEALAGREGQP